MKANWSKWIKRSLATFFIVSSLILLAAHTILRPQALELRLLVIKYTEMNIPQNTGLHQKILMSIKLLSNLLPRTGYIPVQRDIDEIGVGSYTNQQFYAENTISHQQIVNSTEEILQALKSAKPGTEIVVLPGEYHFKGKKIDITAAGEAFAPIILRAPQAGDVTFTMQTSEGFQLKTPFWRFENLIFRGAENLDTWVQHAFHLVGNASYTTFSNNQFINFNAAIKSNGNGKKGAELTFPDEVTIEHNNFYNEWKRNTKSPVIGIDVVGGKNWIIRNNFIADFGKNGKEGVGITYGGYLKGESKNGLIEGNLVVCDWNLPHTSSKDIRIGLSLGGGGTGNKYCAGGKCEFEHQSGIIRNNTIVNCKNDVSIYLNRAIDSQVYNNNLINTLGIDARFKETSAQIYGNHMDGRIKSKDGAMVESFDNDKMENN